MNKEMLIMRYRNRKFYSPTIQTWLTMQEILNEIRDGYTVTIFDKVTKQNITKEVLFTCLSREVSNDPIRLFPINLHEIIRKGGLFSKSEVSEWNGIRERMNFTDLTNY